MTDWLSRIQSLFKAQSPPRHDPPFLAAIALDDPERLESARDWVHPTDIPGLLILDLPVHADARGWFKENWQRAKMTGLGLPDFAPVQQN
ncbi:MAG TPA: dTDP-4-dehydrorhamnose 3,5-epimerase family protein, partial [Anaerolineales bacterium]|nr:dTDP-4-dehydrorhamnose 3,5-epimerase family protein [Anaerolineales bacterium]